MADRDRVGVLRGREGSAWDDGRWPSPPEEAEPYFGFCWWGRSFALDRVDIVELNKERLMISKVTRCGGLTAGARLADSKLKWLFPRLSWQSHAEADRASKLKLTAASVADRTMSSLSNELRAEMSPVRTRARVKWGSEPESARVRPERRPPFRKEIPPRPSPEPDHRQANQLTTSNLHHSADLQYGSWTVESAWEVVWEQGDEDSDARAGRGGQD